MQKWQFLAFWDTHSCLSKTTKVFKFVRRKNQMSLIGRLDVSVIFTKTELRLLRIGKSTTWSQRYRILTALCFDARLLWHWRPTISQDKFKPFERTFISLLLSFYNSSLMQRKKKKKKSSHMKSRTKARTSNKLNNLWDSKPGYFDKRHVMSVIHVRHQTNLWVLMTKKKYFMFTCRLSLA